MSDQQIRVERAGALASLLIVLVALSVQTRAVGLSSIVDYSPNRFLSQSTYPPDFLIQIEPNQFLMRMGTSATPSLVFTPVNGFAGSVALTASISPETPSAPTVSLVPASVFLNASIPGSPSYLIAINSTTATAIGLYTITITAVSGSIIHSATATVGITSAFIPSNGAELVYEGNFESTAYTGSSTVLNSTFEDLGYVQIGIWSLNISTTFGTFQQTFGHGYPLFVNSYGETHASLSIQIPADTKPGTYELTAVISWSLQPGTINMQSAPDLVTHGNVTVYSNPNSNPNVSALSNLFIPLLVVLGVAMAIAITTIVVVLWHENKRNRRISGPDPNFGVSQTGEQLHICPNCGSTVLGGKFCPSCGHQLTLQ